MKTSTTVAAVAVVAAGFAASTASAGFANLQYLGVGKGRNVQYVWNGTETKNVFAGQLRHRLANTSGPLVVVNGDYLTYCTDLFQTVTSTAKSYQQTSIATIPFSPIAASMGNSKAAGLRSLYAMSGAGGIASNASDDLAAAFQLMVWEIVYDFDGTSASLSTTGGNLKFRQTNGNALTTGVQNAFNNLRNSVLANADTPWLFGFASGSNQDQLVFVPTPGSLALMGAAGLLAARPRRAR
ncbi:MAG: hypothetical protein SFY95_10525 [Planctomycetota bacterium]|nr:hypothetical protein [Planctomycetota bacterium]